MSSVGVLSLQSWRDVFNLCLQKDVATQASSKWSLAQWAYYFKTGTPPSADTRHHSTSNSKRAELENIASMQKVYNVISLECTETELAKLVRPPRLVKEIDWVDNCWPDSRKKRKPSNAQLENGNAQDTDDPINGSSTTAEWHANALGDDTVAGKRKLNGDGWPKVKLYCLMGKAGSWTVSMTYARPMAVIKNPLWLQDWHVDFAASCVYYTVITGSKVFFFIKPTPANLAAYARCTCSAGATR